MQDPNQLSFTLTTKDGYEVQNTLGLGKHLFGGAPQSDVVLPDLSQERLFGIVLEIKAKKFTVSVMAFDDGVKVNGKPMPKNKFVPIQPPFTVKYDWVKVRFGEGKRFSEKVPMPAMLLAASVALVAVSYGVSTLGTPAKPVVNMAQVQQPKFEQPRAEIAPLTPAQQASLLAEDLKRRLLSNDLVDKLRVGSQGDKVFISGTLTLDQSYRWKDVVLAARKNYMNVPIQSDVQMARGMGDLAQQIAAISLTPSKYIVGKDGIRYSVGDVLPDGWRVENIGSFGLVISKDGFEETVKF